MSSFRSLPDAYAALSGPISELSEIIKTLAPPQQKYGWAFVIKHIPDNGIAAFFDDNPELAFLADPDTACVLAHTNQEGQFDYGFSRRHAIMCGDKSELAGAIAKLQEWAKTSLPAGTRYTLQFKQEKGKSYGVGICTTPDGEFSA